MSGPSRRNFAHLSAPEQAAYVSAVRQLDLHTYVDGVSWWDKQDQIHQGTHNHGGPSFIPWHRELCNRYEKLLQAIDPSVALHYWDWTQNPRAADNGGGGTVNLCTDPLMGTANGLVGGTLAPLHNGDVFAGSRNATGNPGDPPQAIRRNCDPGSPTVPVDNTIVHGSDGLSEPDQWPSFRVAVEGGHNTAHTFFGAVSNIWNQHTSFQDPFVYLLHSNVDRLFAQWQANPAFPWRLDPDRVYGSEKTTTGDKSILATMAPWDGTVEFGSPIPPWTPGSSDVEARNCRHPLVVRPPCYDTLPVVVSQAAPIPPNPLRFFDVPTGEHTARALRLRVASCRPVTCNAVVTGDPAFSLLHASVTSTDPTGFEVHDLLVWVLFTTGAVSSAANGHLRATTDTGQTFDVDIVANVIAKPTVATSLVLDRSGSMDDPSGVPGKTRMDILHQAAPIFVDLLDDADGIGVVSFDTDATPASTLAVAGAAGSGGARDGARTAISNHATNLAGLTAIGDGLEAAAVQLNGAGGFAKRATVVFTDGHETTDKYISQVMGLINSQVFAVGLGTADQLDPGKLSDLAASTQGYVLLTGNANTDDEMRLQKYFTQILAGVTNADIVTDPVGIVPVGGESVVPYALTEADTRTDVIVLSPAAAYLEVTLVGPDGSPFDAGTVATAVLRPHYQILRSDLPLLPGSPQISGQWEAHLRINRAGLRKALSGLRKEGDATNLAAALETHGVPFMLTVQARSSLHMAVDVVQPSHKPGTVAHLTAGLSQFGIPLDGRAVVDAVVTAPGGLVTTTRLSEIDGGLHAGTLDTPTPGVYSVVFHADGTTFRGEPFTREEVRTLPVWAAGDDRPQPPVGGGGTRGPDWCRLLECVLSDDGIERLAREHEIDIDHLRECVKRSC